MSSSVTPNETRARASGDDLRDVVIIGGGHNGLVAAYYLARAGLDVEVLERREIIGGGCVTEELLAPGYKFSTCASFAWIVHPRIVADLELERHGLRWYAPDPDPVFLYPNNVSLTWWRDRTRALANLAELSAHDAEAYPKWVQLWERARALLAPFLLTDPPAESELRAHAESIGASELLEELQETSIGALTDRYFEDDRVKAALAFIGDTGDPWLPGSAWVCAYWASRSPALPHVMVEGGMGCLTAAMADAAREAGARIRTSAEVNRVLVNDDGRACGVRLTDGTEMMSSIVVSNADPKRTLTQLVTEATLSSAARESVEGRSTVCGAYKLHALISELPDLTAYFGRPATARETASLRILPNLRDRHRAFEKARAGDPPDEPTIGNISIQSVYDPTVAAGPLHTFQSWILYAPTELAEGNWDNRRDEVGEGIIDYISRYLPNLRASLVDWRLDTPSDIETRVGMTDGNIRHLDMIPTQFLRGRWAGRSAYETHLAGLFLCGAGTHPGGEVSGAPGYNCAHAVLRDKQIRVRAQRAAAGR